MESDKASSLRSQVLVGALPDDFLRVTNEGQGTHLHPQQMQASMIYPAQTGYRLSLTIVQATLVKNYGLTKMDPYVRVRVGHSVFETHTSVNGGKTPMWNKVFQIILQPSVDSIYLEIFDERSFTLDDKIAWTHIVIPEKVFKGEIVDDWFSLSGKQGELKEGSINVVMSQSNMVQSPFQHYVCQMPTVPLVYPPQVVVLPQGVPVANPYCGYQPFYSGVVPPQAMQQQPPPGSYGPATNQEVNDKDVDTLVEMFPGFDRSVIRSVLASNQNNKEASINQLLAISS